jgi:hypothetical protein
MKHSVMLTIASLLSILLLTFHLSDDIIRAGWKREGSQTSLLYPSGHPISRESQLDEPCEKVSLTLTVATFEPTHARTTADFQFFQIVDCSSEQKIAACRKESSALETIATLSKGLKNPQRVFSVDFSRRVQTRSSRYERSAQVEAQT